MSTHRLSESIFVRSFVLRPLVWGLAVVWLSIYHQPACAAEFPYTAYILGEQIHSQSGPGEGDYRTDRLDRGQRVAVYKQEQGWCAIRPPSGSFSWVEQRFVELIGTDRGRVRQEKTPCYIGSQVLAKRDRVQVELRAGEMLDVLDSVETAQGMWYKIAPPSGEFRWIASTNLSRDPPAQWPEANTGIVAIKPVDAAAKPNDLSAAGSATNATSVAPVNINTSVSGVLPAAEQDKNKLPQPSGIWQSPTADRWRQDATASNTPIAPGGGGGLPLSVQPINTRTFKHDYEVLEMDIASLLTEDPAAWSIGPLNKRADAMLDQGTSAHDRGKVRMLQAKLSRLEELKQRSLDLQAATVTTAGSRFTPVPANAPITPNPANNATPASVAAAPRITSSNVEQERFDGIGKLMQVMARRPNAPKYAIVDANNNVVAFITPKDGVNLQAYVNQQVGVTGERGYIPELKKPHITVQNVLPADPASLARRASAQPVR